MYFIGVMSGTSCDGIDVALVDFNQGMQTLATLFVKYPEDLRVQLLHVIGKESLNIGQLSELDARLGQLYVKAVNQLLEQKSLTKADIKAIGLHGQTVYHDPDGVFANTLQIGSAAIVAQQTGITTVANFRQMDVAAGGQGAPLAPVFHQQVFSKLNTPLVVLNLGGIANISVIDGDKVIGFDTGPANCLMDEWIHKQKGLEYDENGAWAKQGAVIPNLLATMMSEPFFSQPFPKSTGRELFNLEWVFKHQEVEQAVAVDVQRTLLQVSIESIKKAIYQVSSEKSAIIVCGGGAYNQFFMEQLKKELDVSVEASDSYGVQANYVEAVLMAWLAFQHSLGKRMDLSLITGCDKPHLYGVSFTA